MWLPILITVLASSGNNIGKVLQKQATRSLPRLTLQKDIIAEYLKSRTWVLGMLTDLSGALLMIVAFALAPVRGRGLCGCVAVLWLLTVCLYRTIYFLIP